MIARTWRWQEETRHRRERWLFARRQFEAVPTATPLDNPASVAKQRAAESIEQHSRTTRRLFLPWIVVTMAALLLLPFLDQVPAVIVSLAATGGAVLLGVAAKPLLENAIGGLVLSSSRLVRIGDTVEIDGHYGTIENITATHTTLKIWDWRRYVVPNNQMLQSKLVNYSLVDKFQWTHVEFYVSYEADLNVVKELVVTTARESAHFANHEPPTFWIMATQEHSLRCWVAAWANSPSEAWLLGADIREGIANGFRTHNIATHLVRAQPGTHDVHRTPGDSNKSPREHPPFSPGSQL